MDFSSPYDRLWGTACEWRRLIVGGGSSSFWYAVSGQCELKAVVAAWTRKLAAGVAAVRLFLASHAPRLRRFGLAAALLLFVGGLVLAIRSTPDLFHRIAAGPFVLLLLTVPAGVALNTAEFRLLARYGGHALRWRPALEVTVYTTAANLLPIPGGVLTRMAAMRSYGIPLKASSMLIALFAGIWGGMTFLYSGAWLVHLAHPEAAAAFLVIGCALLLPSIFGLHRIRSSSPLLFATLGLRLLALVLDAVRMMLAVHTVGVAIGFAQASIFGPSGFIANMIFVLPGGLGLAEWLSALLAPLAGIDAAIGFLSASINRISLILGLSCIAALLLSFRSRRNHDLSCVD